VPQRHYHGGMTQTNNNTHPAADAAGFQELTKAQVIALQDEVRKALEVISAKYGLKLMPSRASWSPEGVKITLQMDKQTEDGGNARLAAAWARYAPLENLPMDGVGRTFTTGGKVHTVAGYDVKRRTRPVVTKCANGKSYLWEAATVAALLKQAVKA